MTYRIVNLWILGVAGLFLLSACASSSSLTATGETRDLEQRVQLSQAEGARMDAEVKAMSDVELATELQKDAERFIEPFNSRAYQEVVRRGPSAAAALAAAIDRTDRTRILQLLALRAVSPDGYARLAPSRRIGILIADLRETHFYNAWGLPHLYWDVAGQAMIGEGKRAIRPLRQLLGDTRPAEVWGDEEVMAAREYQYRVRDYAWALIRAIEGKSVSDIPASPSERDALIEAE